MVGRITLVDCKGEVLVNFGEVDEACDFSAFAFFAVEVCYRSFALAGFDKGWMDVSTSAPLHVMK